MGYIGIKTSGCQSTINEHFIWLQSLGYYLQAKDFKLGTLVGDLKKTKLWWLILHKKFNLKTGHDEKGQYKTESQFVLG